MRKRIKFILILAILCTLATFATACKELTKLEEYEKKGYVISVEFNSNGGKFQNSNSVQIMQMYNPNNYTKDENGTAHVKLTEPTVNTTSTDKKITLLNAEHSFIGWFRNRELTKDAQGNIVDIDGNKLIEVSRINSDNDVVLDYFYEINILDYEVTEKDGKQYVGETELKSVGSGDDVKYYLANGYATPSYNYSGKWDFESDALEFNANTQDKLNVTLYAGWVRYLQFNYHYKFLGEEGEWQDYKTGSSSQFVTTFDSNDVTLKPELNKDSIWLPKLDEDGVKLTYEHSSGDYRYAFPKIDSTNFYKAYLDEECANEITTESFKHTTTVDKATGTLSGNRIQHVYVLLERGVRYNISTAEQLNKNADLTGKYVIKADLDFNDVDNKNVKIKWPQLFTNGKFEGEITTQGEVYKIKNVVSKTSSSSAVLGGIFGSVGKNAVISNITFENATYDIANVQTQAQQTSKFGLFAGYIEEGASVSNVTVNGALRIGAGANLNKDEDRGKDFQINLYANGSLSGLTLGNVNVELYGTKVTSGTEVKYSYLILFNTFNVDKTSYNVTFDLTTNKLENYKTNETYHCDAPNYILNEEN